MRSFNDSEKLFMSKQNVLDNYYSCRQTSKPCDSIVRDNFLLNGFASGNSYFSCQSASL